MFKKSKFLACLMACSLFLSQGVYAETAEMAKNSNESSKVVTSDVRYQDDFYNAVNKDWLNNAVIKDGNVSNSAGNEINDRLTEQKKNLINELISEKKNYAANSDEKKIINLYENCMNTEERNKQGVEPIKGILAKIRNIKSLDELNDLDKDNIENPMINIGCGIDLKDATKYALYIEANSLTLGSSDEYTNPSENTAQRKELISNYYVKILTLAGCTEEEAKAKVDNLFKFENMIAPYMMGQEEASKDDDKYNKMYNVVTLDELDKMAPNLKIKDYIKNLNADNAQKIILTEPKWFKALNDIYKSENLQMFKDYIEIKNLASYTLYLSDDFIDAANEVTNQLYGSQGETPKDEIALSIVESCLSMPFSRVYVNKYFDPQIKANVEDMIKNIVSNYKSRIQKLNWMSDTTKANALKKLDNLKIYVGYPNKWEDYSALDIKSYDEGGSLVENIISTDKFYKEKQMKKLNTTVDADKMSCSPLTVDAMYNPQNNSITIPAGILQKPMYDMNASKEQNYGGIGTIIGHEISHAFDNSGCRFDSDGNLADWWTQDDYSKFKEKTQKVRDFYSKIKTDNGDFVNGDLTVGENIADISGVACCLDIVKSMDNPNYKDFFESYATIWRQIATPEYLKNSLQFNVHSPHKVRVNAVLSQFEEFYQTYGITENDKMYVKPEDRLLVW